MTVGHLVGADFYKLHENAQLMVMAVLKNSAL